MRGVKIRKLLGLSVLFGIYLFLVVSVVSAAKFNIGDTVEVYNTGSSGLIVRGPNACDAQIGGKFDGSRGVVLAGPVFCNSYNRWKIRWNDDSLEGWSAEDYLKKVVNQQPECFLSANPKSGKAPLTVTFSMSASDLDGSISVWGLDVGDGNSYSGYGNPPSTKTHTYTTPGSYSVVLMVLDNDGASDVDTETIVVGENNPPICSLTPDKNSEKAPLAVTFSISASDPDGWISSWELLPNDGSPAYTGTGNPPSTKSHTYTSSGTFTAILGVTDNEGVTTFDTKTITVYPPNVPPDCSLTASPRSGKAPLPVTFTMSASDPDGSITAWVLDVNGDGNADYLGIGNPPSVLSHTYTANGSYTSMLVVSDNDRGSDFDVETINVGPENIPPDCSLFANPKSGNTPLTVTFTMSASDPDGSISTWVLDVGDGNSYSGSGNPPSTQKHIYTSQGNYNVVLAVADNDNATDFVGETINVYAPTQLPSVSTFAPSNINLTSATSNGNLDSTGGETCQVWFEYGLTASYGQTTPKRLKSSTGPFSESISKLSPETTYHFKACASNSKGTVCSADADFTTLVDLISRCSDGIKNSDETDIDCGGSCPPCEDRKSCLQKADCLSKYCNPKKICSIPSCHDSWKNGDETGIDCGGSCPVCPPPSPSCSDGIQNGYEEGIDCGGVCPNECDYELTILMIPVNWQGTYGEFRTKADQVSQYFLERIPFKDCPNKYKTLISDETDYDKERILWGGWKCYIPEYAPGCFLDGEFTLKIIEGCAKKYGTATGKKYDYVVGMTDLEKVGSEPYIDFFGKLKCKNQAAGWTTWNSDAVISTTSDIGTVSHELGHQFGFSDQYCDCSGIIYEGINLGSYCGPSAPINPLNKTLGCDYDGNCCWTSGRELYPGCYKQCNGNFDRFWEDTNHDDTLDSGHRTIMSALVPRNHYDTTEYQYLKKIFQCPTKTTSTLSIFSQGNEDFTNKSILELSLDITIHDNVTLNYINITFGDPLITYSMPGNYSLKILNGNETILYKNEFNLNFLIFSDQSYFTNHTNLYLKIPYNTSMHKTQLYHNGNLIFEHEINFCDFDDRCDSNENHFSCPNDCESWYNDGTCNDQYDGVCDSDCLPKYDIDCIKTVNITPNQGWNIISIPLILENNSFDYLFNNTNFTIYSYKNNSWFIPNEINNKLGYWLKINENKNITLIGTEIEDKNIILNEEWNLISYPYVNEIGINNSDLKNYTIFTYINDSWLSYIPNKPFNSLQTLTPSYGYWLKK